MEKPEVTRPTIKEYLPRPDAADVQNLIGRFNGGAFDARGATTAQLGRLRS